MKSTIRFIKVPLVRPDGAGEDEEFYTEHGDFFKSERSLNTGFVG